VLEGVGFFKAHLELQNVGKKPLSILDRAPFVWTVRVTDPEGRKVKPNFVRSDVFSMPRRIRLKPGESRQVSVSKERATDVEIPGGGNVGLLDTTNQIWHLPIGRYRVSAVYFSRFREERDKPADAWSGEVSVPAVDIEVLPAAGAAAAEGTAWGKPRDGLRLGLAPARAVLGARDMNLKVRVWYENVGKEPREVPVHHAHVNAYRLMFAGEKEGKPFYVVHSLMVRTELIPPGRKTLKPGERFSEEFRFAAPPAGWKIRSVLPLRLPNFGAGESLTLRAGLCARFDPRGEKEWNAPDTLRSGAITVARAAR